MITSQRNIVGKQQSGDKHQVIRCTIMIWRWIAVTIYAGQLSSTYRDLVSDRILSRNKASAKAMETDGEDRTNDKRTESISR
ncbi:hypothetical protein GGD67_002935 [Bradyrhizobium sp. IAR9]|nr:hypothetical protein [Bradyrhizobium sp. IAR9]